MEKSWASMKEDFQEIFDFVQSNLEDSLVSKCCTVLAIPHEQLFYKPPTEFEDFHMVKNKLPVRFQHHEARRKACLQVICQHIIENQLVRNSKNGRTQSAVSKSRDQPEIVPYVPISPRQAAARKIEVAKHNIIKRIKVEKKRQKLKEEFDKERLNKGRYLENKLSKSVKREINKKFFESHDKRIQEILSKKYKDIQERELKALGKVELKKEEKIGSSTHHFSPRKTLSLSEEEEIQQKLLKIHLRLNNSCERAKKNLEIKANPSSNFVVSKVLLNKEEIEQKKQEELAKAIEKIKQNAVESNKRREERAFNEQQRRARSSKAIEIRRIEEQLKIDQEMSEKNKDLELKQEKREKSVQNRRENFDKVSKAISSKNLFRKMEQLKNLQKIDKHFREMRNEIIEKIKEGDGRIKNFIDYSKLRKRVEQDMKNRKDDN